MADFDLTQTDQQVQNILNDAQGAMGASAQTTLTTEYVMLKDTSGVYHKILKSSFTEAIRDVLAGLLVNNDKGTTINQIAAIASGDFGSITPANLASVLGGLLCQGNNNKDVDLNDWNETGFYMIQNYSSPYHTITNAPSNIPSTSSRDNYFAVLVLRASGWRFQLGFHPVYSNKMWFRVYNTTWGEWKETTFQSITQ